MPPEILSEIELWVRMGVYSKQELMEIFCEELYEPGELGTEDVSAALERSFDCIVAEQATWPTVTDCDRLDNAFLAMDNHGIIALQNAGCTQSDGYNDFIEIYKTVADKNRIIGYCFYHGQDLGRAVDGGGLYLGFGSADPKKQQEQGVKVGQIVQSELEKVNFTVRWNNTVAERIYIPDIIWQKRISEIEWRSN